MTALEISLPRRQWEDIRDAADKASPASLYQDYPGLHQSYVGIYRAVKEGLDADPEGSEVAITISPLTLTSIFTLPEFNGLRGGMPPREQWFGA